MDGNMDKDQIQRIFIRSLDRLRISLQSLDKLIKTPSQRNGQNPLSEDDIQRSLGDVYEHLRECWTIAEKIRQMSALSREILEIDQGIEDIN